jgi:hypothetical protein
LEISRDTGVTIAADLRIPGHLRMGTVTASGEVIETRSLSTPTTAAVSEALIDFSRQLTSDAILGIALGVQGWVNAEGEWIEDLEESVDPKIMLDLRKTLRVPVFALNSTDAMTLSDLRDSPAGLSAQATIAMDSRISAGLVIGGRLRTGVYRPAGDIAHIVTGPSGPQCPKCGQPCLNASIMPLTADQSAPAQQLAAQALGTVMAPIAAAVELDEIVLAGFPGPVAQPMAQQTRSEMLLRMPREQMPSVRVSERGADAVLVGSAAMMLYRRLA